MATNRFGAACATCSAYVRPEAGVLVRSAGQWVTYCATCEPRPVPPPRRGHDGWHRGPLASFDLETSGVDPATDFVVTAALVDDRGTSRTWLLDPGEQEIPAAATAIHGITTAAARERGRPARECLEEIAAALAEYLAAGTPLVVFNAAFDLTMLRARLAEHGLPPLEERVPVVGPVVDPFLIDRQMDRYRRGRRTLGACCEHYGVPLEGAHTADGDARAALALARELGARFPEAGEMPARELHRWQITWAAEQAASYRAYLDRTRPGHGEVVRDQWPVVTG